MLSQCRLRAFSRPAEIRHLRFTGSKKLADSTTSWPESLPGIALSSSVRPSPAFNALLQAMSKQRP
jgi:hypothetical protein